jgi:hypothetical protein
VAYEYHHELRRNTAGAFALVSPLLPARTRAKVSVVSSRAAKATLLEHIDEVELPKFLGGLKEDDGMCCAAGPVPEGKVVCFLHDTSLFFSQGCVVILFGSKIYLRYEFDPFPFSTPNGCPVSYWFL